MREALAEWRPVVDDAIAEIIPRELTRDALIDAYGDPSYEYDLEGAQRALADPVWDLLDRGGKRWRAVLFLKLVEGFGESPEEYVEYAVVPELLHNGTILVDDVEDGAALRRGEPAIHEQYGVDVAINAGNALYFLPLSILAADPADLPAADRLRAYDMLATELNRSHLGQGLDICWHGERGVRATEAEYLEMSACKTGCLGRIVARMAAIVTGQDEATEERVAAYAEAASTAFQIGDDVLDAETALRDGGAFGKAFGNDVREGKTTLLVLHALRECDPDAADRLRRVLAADDVSDEDVAFALETFESTGAIEYARDVALDLSETARAELEDVPLEESVAEALAAFTRYVVERDA